MQCYYDVYLLILWLYVMYTVNSNACHVMSKLTAKIAQQVI